MNLCSYTVMRKFSNSFINSLTSFMSLFNRAFRFATCCNVLVLATFLIPQIVLCTVVLILLFNWLCCNVEVVSITAF